MWEKDFAVFAAKAILILYCTGTIHFLFEMSVASLHQIIIITDCHCAFVVDVAICAHVQDVPMSCFKVEGIAQCVTPLCWRWYVLILYYNIDFTIKVILNNIQDSNKLYRLDISRYFFLFVFLFCCDYCIYVKYYKGTHDGIFLGHSSDMNKNCMFFILVSSHTSFVWCRGQILSFFILGGWIVFRILINQPTCLIM